MSPVTSKAASNVTSSSTFNVPLIVVMTPLEAIFTTPPPVAKEVAPDESNVVTEVSPVTSKVPVISVLPPIFAFSAIPTPPSTIKAPDVLLVDVVVAVTLTCWLESIVKAVVVPCASPTPNSNLSVPSSKPIL